MKNIFASALTLGALGVAIAEWLLVIYIQYLFFAGGEVPVFGWHIQGGFWSGLIFLVCCAPWVGLLLSLPSFGVMQLADRVSK